eukprot:760646-Hanusia_phi.AAC.3
MGRKNVGQMGNKEGQGDQEDRAWPRYIFFYVSLAPSFYFVARCLLLLPPPHCSRSLPAIPAKPASIAIIVAADGFTASSKHLVNGRGGRADSFNAYNGSTILPITHCCLQVGYSSNYITSSFIVWEGLKACHRVSCNGYK